MDFEVKKADFSGLKIVKHIFWKARTEAFSKKCSCFSLVVPIRKKSGATAAIRFRWPRLYYY